jgi:hypothetical protein
MGKWKFAQTARGQLVHRESSFDRLDSSGRGRGFHLRRTLLLCVILKDDKPSIEVWLGIAILECVPA